MIYWNCWFLQHIIVYNGVPNYTSEDIVKSILYMICTCTGSIHVFEAYIIAYAV